MTHRWLNAGLLVSSSLGLMVMLLHLAIGTLTLHGFGVGVALAGAVLALASSQCWHDLVRANFSHPPKTLFQVRSKLK